MPFACRVGAKAMCNATHAIRGVMVVGELRSALVCDVAGRRVVIPRAVVLEGSDVHKRGDRGCLVVPEELVLDLGLAEEIGSPR